MSLDWGGFKAAAAISGGIVLSTGPAEGVPQVMQKRKNAILRVLQVPQWLNSVMPQWTQKFDSASPVVAIGRSQPGHWRAAILRDFANNWRRRRRK